MNRICLKIVPKFLTYMYRHVCENRSATIFGLVFKGSLELESVYMTLTKSAVVGRGWIVANESGDVQRAAEGNVDRVF